MKKIGLKTFAIGALSFILVACGNSEETSNDKPKENKKAIETSNSDELSQAEWMEQQEKEQGEVKAEVVDKVFYTWVDKSIGNVEQINTYAVIKNTGEETIDVSQTKVTYLNDSGEVIGVTDANEIYTNLSPSIIAPGDVAYLGVKDDVGEEFAELKDIQVDVSPLAVEFKPNKLEASKTKIIKTDDWGGDVSVTGFLANKENTEASKLQVAAGLYNKEDKFIGVLLLSSDDETIIQANGNSSIELEVPSFPSSTVTEVDHADIQAISLVNN